ncbi:microtubule-associated protein TORTIFOLIA1 isoform X2 [Dendrobium catenatum]|uniref:microtubule-associated protein TORTIFOLIA1 isoform X2 n=1 Tax=Dendrobium catenatum TaxID=906689 RepID=UPI00109F8B39|nr:microtubule-associated protein TORTIFOLIA1 isoform X2 [Dendrobium catenatum]
MSSTTRSSSKASKSPSQSSLSSHLAMLDLKSRILSSLSKLSDRDTHQIAVDDLENIISSLPADGFPMFLSSLLHDPIPSPGDPTGARSSPIVARRESIRLLALLCAAYPDSAAAHLPKIINLIVRRLKDPVSDASLRDACGDAAGSLAAIYLRSNAEETGNGRSGAAAPVAGLFVKPLLEVMGEQSKTVQAGAAMCLGKVVEGGGGGGGGGAAAFQRLCPRICKMIGAQSCLAKGSLLSVLSKLAQVGAISSQSMPNVLQSVRECLENNDWATRKAAADTFSVLASQSSHLIADGASQTIASLEACRFDKVKPVRESVMEALQLWKKISDKGAESLKGHSDENLDSKDLNLNSDRQESVKDSSADSSSTGGAPLSPVKCTILPENAADLLKIKAPSLKDKELNPEFFQKLESRNSDDVPVEVVVPRKRPQSSHSKDGKEKGSAEGGVVAGCELNENLEHSYRRYNTSERRLGAHGRQQNSDFLARDKFSEQLRFRDSKLRGCDASNRVEFNPGDSFASRSSISRTDGLVESSFMNNKVNWLGIQRQLSHLERQQAYLMNMLQHFMEGSHDSLITLEDRVHGLERVVEEMARDLSISFGRRGGNMTVGFEGSPVRSLATTMDFKTTTSKFGRGAESRIPYLSTDGMASVSRGKEFYAHAAPRRGLMASSAGGRLLRNEHGGDQVGSGRRAWDKADGPFRLGEGPSARSVWQASKDEATLEAIRVAGDDNGTSRAATRRPVPEKDMDAMADGDSGQEGAMDSIRIGDVDSAYAEVLSRGDDVMLLKLMERSGPVINELSDEVAIELLHAVGQLLLEQSLFDIAFAWIQQVFARSIFFSKALIHRFTKTPPGADPALILRGGKFINMSGVQGGNAPWRGSTCPVRSRVKEQRPCGGFRGQRPHNNFWF